MKTNKNFLAIIVAVTLGIFQVKGQNSATGGVITYSGGYTLHTFTTGGTFTPNGTFSVDYLVVGGGGGGGAVSLNQGAVGGGGGAGGMLTGSSSVTAQAYAITIGSGGNGGAVGANNGATGSSSIINSIATATGGGYGGAGRSSSQGNVGGNGGSGGGGGGGTNPQQAGGTGTGGEGSNGATAAGGGSGGGGGGKGGAGSGSTGGAGSISAFTGATYAVGGNANTAFGLGVQPTAQTANTGNGGHGAWGAAGGNGGSGIVIIRYLTSPPSWTTTGNTLTTASTAAIGSTVNNNFIGTTDAVDFTFATNNLERMRILSAGEVGIGTKTPGSALDVKGTLRLSGSTSGYVGFAPAAAAGSTTYTLPSADGTNGQVLNTNGSGVLSWTSAVGPTGPTGATGAAGAQGATGPTGTFGIAGTTGQTIYHNGTAWAATSHLYNNGTNIGIGTATPGEKLEMYKSTAGNYIRLNTYNGNWLNAETLISGIKFDYQTNQGTLRTKASIYAVNESPQWNPAVGLSFYTGPYDTDASERLRIAGDGNVGIGTITPGSALDVKGTLRLSGSTSGYVGFAPAAAAGSTTYTLPSADGTNGQFLSTNGSGTLSWGTVSGGTLSGGTTNYIPKWTSSTTLSSTSLLYDDGTNIGINTTSPGAKLEVKGSADATQFIVKAHSTQSNTNPLIALKNSSGSTLLAIHSDATTNVFVGVDAGRNNAVWLPGDEGVKNTFLGFEAGYSHTNAFGNIFVGSGAGYYMTTGDFNTIIGLNADAPSCSTCTNMVIIGNQTTGTASNEARFGNSNITTFYCQGAYAATTASAANMFVSSGGQIMRSTSSGRYKKDIVDMEINTSKIYDLRPVTYTSTSPYDKNMRQFGLIAEEVARVIPELAYFTEEKNVIKGSASDKLIPDAVQYPLLAVLLLKEVQNHQKGMDSLKTVIRAMQSEMKSCCTGTHQGGNSGTQIPATTIHELELANSAILFQNSPNPFGEGTTIKYFVPDNSQAQIVFYDEFGNMLKELSVTEKGMGQLNISAMNLAAGVYSYSLLVNGKVVDTKRMMKVQ